MKINSSDELVSVICDCISDLRSGSADPKVVAEISNCAGKIMGIGRIQMQHEDLKHKLGRKTALIKFWDSK